MDHSRDCCQSDQFHSALTASATAECVLMGSFRQSNRGVVMISNTSTPTIRERLFAVAFALLLVPPIIGAQGPPQGKRPDSSARGASGRGTPGGRGGAAPGAQGGAGGTRGAAAGGGAANRQQPPGNTTQPSRGGAQSGVSG